MRTIADLQAHAERRGWQRTSTLIFTARRRVACYELPDTNLGLHVWFQDGQFEKAYLYRDGELDHRFTTSDDGVALGWITAHGTEVAA